MARIVDGLKSGGNSSETYGPKIISLDGSTSISVPHCGYTGDAQMSRDGHDLVLESPDGNIIIIEGYFLAEPAPLIEAEDGSVLTPELVESFAKSSLQFAQSSSINDESPVGAIEEIKGEAIIIRANGTQDIVTIGTPVYQGDIIETSETGAVNIVFLDETSMAISKDARFAINEYTFDPSNESGSTNFSILRGVFVFTSGLIGRDDPDDVEIETPVGSIGIRGTIIAGNIDPGGETEISVLEGAIVVRNGFGEKTLSTQFETVKLGGYDQPMSDSIVLSANDVGNKFGAVSDVAPTLFSAVNDSVQENRANTPQSQSQNNGESAEDSNNTNSESSNEGTEPTQEAQPEPAQQQKGDVGDRLLQTGFEKAEFNEGGKDLGLKAQAPQIQTQDGTKTGPQVSVKTPPSAPNKAATGEKTGEDKLLNTEPLPPQTTQTTAPQINSDNTLHINSPNAARGVSVIIDNIGNEIGYDLTAIGDANNDGYADFMFTNNTANTSQNHSYIVYGSAAGIPSGMLPNLTSSNITTISDSDAGAGDITTLLNNIPGTNHNNTVIAGIGDFDGDGIEDYIIGQRYADDGSNINSGNAAIVSGAPASGLNVPDISIFLGISSGDQFGYAITGVGDVNNDGYADVLIGAPGSDGSYADSGKAYLVYGADVIGTTISTTSLLSVNGMTFYGSAYGEHFATSVAGAGDFDSDGKSDFIIGAPGGNRATIVTDTNTIDIHHTASGYGFGEEVQGLGDINGDGKSDVMIAGSIATNEAYFVSGGLIADITDIDNYLTSANIVKINTGSQSLLGGGAIGDWNGDGYDDFAVAVSNGTNADIYVLYGTQNIFGKTTIDLNFLSNPQNAFKMIYEGGGAANFLIEGLGDIDGDGFDDMGIGISSYNASNTSSTINDGQIIVVEGRDANNSILEASNTTANHLIASADDISLVGNQYSNVIEDGNHTNVNMRGGAGNDSFEIHNTLFRSIDGGTGYDSIITGTSLDFTNIDFEQINSIEKIQVQQSNQTITLTLENIFNMLKTSDVIQVNPGVYKQTLKIEEATGVTGTTLILDLDGDGVNDGHGNNNDDVATITAAMSTYLGSDPTVTGSANAGATAFNSFEIGNYTLYIDNNIAVDAQ